jgi:hypothetical protein
LTFIGDKNVRDYLRESFRTSVLARLAHHEGTLFSLTVECGRDPTELVVGINAQQNPYITRIRFIDKRSVVEVIDRDS